MANGTTLEIDGSLLYPNGSRTLTNGTLVEPNVTVSSVLPYEIKLDGAYGVLGSVLIVTGAPVCILGGKNRWTSLFLLYFYAGAFLTLVLAVHFGVSVPENPPSATMRGVFVLVGAVVGGLAGSVAILIAGWARFGLTFIGGWSVAWWILSFGQGGLINALWGRWVLFAGLSTVVFVLGLHPRTHNPLTVLSTSFVGATAFILGIDCFTRAGLKELYVWNLGFRSIFDVVLKPHGGRFRLGDVGIVEIALIGILWVIGFAIQFKVWDHLLRPLPALSRTERRARRESRALDAERRVTRHDDELNAWETAHGKGPRDLDGRGWAEKGLDSPSGSNAVLKRTDSGWGSASGSTSALQDGVAVPVLGQKSSASRHAAREADRQELDQKEKLLGEIQTIRRSIDALRSASPGLIAPASPRLAAHGLPSSAFTASSSASQAPTATPAPVLYQPLPALSELGRSVPMQPSASSRPGPASDWNRYLEKRQIVQSSPSSPAALDEFGRSDRPWASSRSQRGHGDRSTRDLPIPPLAVSGSSAGRPSHARQPSSTTLGPAVSGAAPPSSPPKRHAPTRSLSRDELADRHSQLLRKMQSSATDSLEADRAREEWHARQLVERDEEARKRESMAALLAEGQTGCRRKSGAVDVDGWRSSIAVDDARVRPPMGGPSVAGRSGSLSAGRR